ncbi:MAG: serine/threonine protein kinase [Clostridiales Family XIII bacterium]|nr:serine/threonine protein kinase [Clostridiales Family XIII bacterium]
MARIGDIIEGKYEILKQIGKGGMSRVYLAMDKRLNKQWAIKEIQRKGTDPRLNEVVINSAIVEANMIKSLDHYHIPHINDILEYDDYIYVVMDYVEGESLAKILQTEGPQPEKQVIKWGKQLTDALHYLHTQNPPIIYRDMKPANVMVKPDGDIKLIDFGIAREYKERNLADTTVLGTVGYAPPEQFGGGQTDARADIFALGATMFHAVTGIGPKKGEAFIIRPIRDVIPGLSGGLEKIILKCTHPNPNERYQSAGELMYDLDHYQEVDDAFLAKQRSKLKIFIAMAICFLAFLAVGAVGQGMRIHTNNTDYAQNLVWAENAPEQTEKIGYYRKMIDIKPTEEAPYTGMINTYKADTDFSLDEEAELLDAVTPHLAGLREEAYYPGLAYELGKLYWYYYAYGRSDGDADDSNRSTRMRSSVRWFKDVLDFSSEQDENYRIAQIYHDIGLFNENINTDVAEASDTGKYKPYWDNLIELMGLLSESESDTEIVSLTVDSIVLEAIGVYARKFAADGITESEMRALYDEAVADAQRVNTTTDKTEQLKADVTAQAEIAADSIESAFRKDERGLEY